MIETVSIQDLKTSYEDLRKELNNSGGFFDVPADREELKQYRGTCFVARVLGRSGQLLRRCLQKRSCVGKKTSAAGEFRIARSQMLRCLIEFAEEDEASLAELRTVLCQTGSRSRSRRNRDAARR